MPAQFVLPPVEENADGWGPTSIPEQFDGVPFMPYSKGERLGRIADFGQQAGRGMFAGAQCPRVAGGTLPCCCRLPVWITSAA